MRPPFARDGVGDYLGAAEAFAFELRRAMDAGDMTKAAFAWADMVVMMERARMPCAVTVGEETPDEVVIPDVPEVIDMRDVPEDTPTVTLPDDAVMPEAETGTGAPSDDAVTAGVRWRDAQ